MRGFGVFLGVFAACAAAAALGAVWLWPHVKDLTNPIARESARAKAEAAAFAGEHEQLDCTPEAFHRVDTCDGIWCLASTPEFTRECLERAAPSSGLCDELPDSTVLAMAWPTTECLEIEADPALCRRILGELVKLCKGGAEH